MKIKVEPGHRVVLDKDRNASTRGGTYDISNMDVKARKRVLDQKGVSEVKSEAKPAASQKKEG